MPLPAADEGMKLTNSNKTAKEVRDIRFNIMKPPPEKIDSDMQTTRQTESLTFCQLKLQADSDNACLLSKQGILPRNFPLLRRKVSDRIC
jgi:hypothetical protein